jgi:hypothetical protein
VGNAYAVTSAYLEWERCGRNAPATEADIIEKWAQRQAAVSRKRRLNWCDPALRVFSSPSWLLMSAIGILSPAMAWN